MKIKCPYERQFACTHSRRKNVSCLSNSPKCLQCPGHVSVHCSCSGAALGESSENLKRTSDAGHMYISPKVKGFRREDRLLHLHSCGKALLNVNVTLTLSAWPWGSGIAAPGKMKLSINLTLGGLLRPRILVMLEGHFYGSHAAEHESLIYGYLTFAGTVIHSLDTYYIYFNSF